jgi:hypothetical protein
MAKACNNCGTEEMAVMPIAQHEKDQNRLMSIIKSLIAVIIVLIVLLVGSNIAWIIYENSFEEVIKTTEEYYDVEQDADGGGDNNSIINGGIINGEAESKLHEENNDQNP